jgi:hypothetical protein
LDGTLNYLTAPLYSDQLGSANAATNAASAVIWEERYTPFGELMINAAQNEDEAGPCRGLLRLHSTHRVE